MRYFATIRVELPVGSPEEAKREAVRLVRDLTAVDDNLNPYLCYVTEQDGLESKEIVNNID